MRKLIAKLVNGEITRRDFATRVVGMGFGMMTVESILDTVTVAGESNRPAKNAETFRAEPFSEKTPYEQWIEKEAVPILEGYFVVNVRTAQLKPWKRLGANGAIINLEGAEATDGAYLCEIAPGASTNPQRYMFEESIYVLDGEGETTVWHENRPKQTFKWKKGTLFSPPLNTWRIHKNTGRVPARFISVTDLPLVMDLYHNADFIFNNDFVFRDRYNNQPDYFTVNESKMKIAGSAATFGEGEKGAVGVLDTGLIPDLNQIQLFAAKARGLKNKSAEVILSDNSDRKSTRLNSSHSQISYAVFCLKKKNNYQRLAACRALVADRLTSRTESPCPSPSAPWSVSRTNRQTRPSRLLCRRQLAWRLLLHAKVMLLTHSGSLWCV